MKFMRRILGVLVMIAGILGLLLSLAGLVGIWVATPIVSSTISSTIDTLVASVNTSQKAMEVTGQALGATVDSVDALSEMLATTATSVEDTKPVLDQINEVMGQTLPSTLLSATQSLLTAQKAAEVLDGAIKSLETFRALMSGVPFVGAVIAPPTETYNPEVPLAESLGELAGNLSDLPDTFTAMSENLGKADDNLDSIQGNLTTMSDSVSLISKSLAEYQTMVSQSKSSMESLKAMLTGIQNNLTNTVRWAAIVFSLFFLWLLAAQVVILSQGLELFHGTATRMEGAAVRVEETPAEDAGSPESKPEE